jgi:hypothetical protein
VVDREIMEGGGHFMDDEEDNDAEWAVGDGGGAGKHKNNF